MEILQCSWKCSCNVLLQFVRRPSSGSDWKALAKTHTYKNGNTLREYQLEGVNWLTFSWYKR